MSKLRILLELLRFLWGRKNYWIIPIVLFIGLLGLLVAAAHGSVVAPFIYTLF